MSVSRFLQLLDFFSLWIPPAQIFFISLEENVAHFSFSLWNLVTFFTFLITLFYKGSWLSEFTSIKFLFSLYHWRNLGIMFLVEQNSFRSFVVEKHALSSFPKRRNSWLPLYFPIPVTNWQPLELRNNSYKEKCFSHVGNSQKEKLRTNDSRIWIH